MTESAAEGIEYRPGDGGTISTLSVAKRIFSTSVEAVDPALAARIGSEPDWRKNYAKYGVSVMLAGLKSREAAISMARAGLKAVHESLQFTRDGKSLPVTEVAPAGGIFSTEAVQGEQPRISTFRVPAGGKILEGDSLKRELVRWRDSHLAEPDCVEKLLGLLDDPSPLDLREKTFVLLGAGAEVGPLRPLLEWGATVVAVDMDRPEVHERISSLARTTAGRVLFPVRAGRPAGANLLTDLPEILGWLGERETVDTIGAYAYLDGEKHVRVSAAMDRIVGKLSETHPKALVAYLMTPTEVFVVPESAAAVSRAAFEARSPFVKPLRALSRGRLFEANVRAEAMMDGAPHAIIDSVEARQGANYLLAKRMQRWRVFLAQEAGRRVSCNVAPMTRTRSVLSNRVYAAGYRGTKPLGIETFDAATTNTVMAALLVLDGLQPEPRPPLPHPEQILRDRAFHGGLWTCPYQLRTIIEAGVAAGIFSRG